MLIVSIWWLFSFGIILCFIVPTVRSPKSNSIWWGISLYRHFTQTCQGQVTVGLSPAPAAAATHRPSVGDAHYLCSPHHCSDGLCRHNNTSFSLVNDYSCRKTTAFPVGFDLRLDFYFKSRVKWILKVFTWLGVYTGAMFDWISHLLQVSIDELELWSYEPPVFFLPCRLKVSEELCICPKVSHTLQYPSVK